jgi:leucyl-tRNA---protein transferase
MSLPEELPLKRLQFYVTTPYRCGYLPKLHAQSLIAAPHHLVDAAIYSGLIQQGFRRSGKFAYRPHCEACCACVPVRIILDEFTPNRSQKRAFRQHHDLNVRILPLGFHQSHFELYREYQSYRHAEQDNPPKEDEDEIIQYQQFLCQSNVESRMIEFRDAKHQVKIVSVVDIVADGVSAVYTFYDAKDSKASYGTFAIMFLAEWTKNLKLPYLYLGYWIKDSQKMHYKQRFQPQEKLIGDDWVR